MEDNANLEKDQPDEFSAETLSAAKIFERLSPKDQQKILELLHKINVS